MHLRGFSLVELLVALAIAAILLILGVPSLISLPEQDRATAALNHIIGAVSFARSAAVLQRAPVTLCPASNGQCLARDQWHRGALIFRDPNENGLREPGEPVHAHRGSVRWNEFRRRWIMVIENDRSETLTHVPLNVVSEHAQKYMRSDAFLQPMVDGPNFQVHVF